MPTDRVVSLLFLDRIFEGIAIVVIFLPVVIWGQIPPPLEGGVVGFTLLVAGSYAVLVCLAHRYRHFDAEEKPAQKAWKGRARFFKKVARSLGILKDLRSSVTVIGLAVLVKASEVAALHVLQMGLGIGLPLWGSFLVLTAIEVFLFVPVTPANLGVYEASIFLVCQFLGVEPVKAAGYALLYHALHLLPILLAGSFSLTRSRVDFFSLFSPRLLAPSQGKGA